jgi:hypothetical protein
MKQWKNLADAISTCGFTSILNPSRRVKLYYVRYGELVSFFYMAALVEEIRYKGANPLDFITVTKDHISDVNVINQVVNWLMEHYPNDYTVTGKPPEPRMTRYS